MRAAVCTLILAAMFLAALLLDPHNGAHLNALGRLIVYAANRP